MICASTWTVDDQHRVHCSADTETVDLHEEPFVFQYGMVLSDTETKENAFDHAEIIRDASGVPIGTWSGPVDDFVQSFNHTPSRKSIRSEAGGTWVKSTNDFAQSLSVIWDLLFESCSDNDIIAGYRHFRRDRAQ